MFTKLHNIVLCAVFPLDKMMGEVVENANNLGWFCPNQGFMCIHMGMCTYINEDYLNCDPAQKPGLWSLYVYQREINSTVAPSSEQIINTNWQ